MRVRACVRARVCARVRTRVCRTGQKDNGTSQRPPASSIVSLNSDKRPPSPSLSFSFSFCSSSSSSASLQGRDRDWVSLEVGSRPRSAASLEFRVSTAAHTQLLRVHAVLPGTPAGADTRAGFLWQWQSEVRPRRLASSCPRIRGCAHCTRVSSSCGTPSMSGVRAQTCALVFLRVCLLALGWFSTDRFRDD